MKKVISLVNPPFLHFPGDNLSGSNYCRPPLGLCYLAASLRKSLGERNDILITDALIERRPETEWINLVARQEPEIIGFTVVTPTVPVSIRMAQELRKLCPGAILIAGGPHATVRPEDLLPTFDIVVIGEGECTFVEVADAINKRKGFECIAGVTFMENGGVTRTERRKLMNPLDDIPFPARDLLKPGAYYHYAPYRHKKGFFNTIFTARGCPFNCIFCANEALWNRTIRFHSLEYVAGELEILISHMNTTVLFIDDDNFMMNKSHAYRISESIIKLNSGLKWFCHACISSIDEELLRIMKRAGCVEIQIGVESGSQDILNTIPKCSTRELVIEKIQLMKKVGINSWATFMLGHEGDTPDTIMDTIRFSIKIDPTCASFNTLVPFPGTRVYENYRENGYIITDNWDAFSWYGDPIIEKPDLNAGDLKRLRSVALKRFYLRPGKMFWIFLRALQSGSLREIFRNFFAWLSLVK